MFQNLHEREFQTMPMNHERLLILDNKLVFRVSARPSEVNRIVHILHIRFLPVPFHSLILIAELWPQDGLRVRLSMEKRAARPVLHYMLPVRYNHANSWWSGWFIAHTSRPKNQHFHFQFDIKSPKTHLTTRARARHTRVIRSVDCPKYFRAGNTVTPTTRLFPDPITERRTRNLERNLESL